MKPTCCKSAHIGAEMDKCGCEIALCFGCGDERLIQPCTECAKKIQERL